MELIPKNVDGIEYQFQKFGTKKSLRILIRLTKFLGKPAAALIGAFKGEGSLVDRELDGDIIATAVSQLVDNMNEDDVLDLVEEITGRDNLLADGKKIVWESHYAGRLDHLFKVLYAGLEVQYGNFIAAIAGPLEAKKVKTALTPAPIQSTG